MNSGMIMSNRKLFKVVGWVFFTYVVGIHYLGPHIFFTPNPHPLVLGPGSM